MEKLRLHLDATSSLESQVPSPLFPLGTTKSESSLGENRIARMADRTKVNSKWPKRVSVEKRHNHNCFRKIIVAAIIECLKWKAPDAETS